MTRTRGRVVVPTGNSQMEGAPPPPPVALVVAFVWLVVAPPAPPAPELLLERVSELGAQATSAMSVKKERIAPTYLLSYEQPCGSSFPAAAVRSAACWRAPCPPTATMWWCSRAATRRPTRFHGTRSRSATGPRRSTAPTSS